MNTIETFHIIAGLSALPMVYFAGLRMRKAYSPFAIALLVICVLAAIAEWCCLLLCINSISRPFMVNELLGKIDMVLVNHCLVCCLTVFINATLLVITLFLRRGSMKRIVFILLCLFLSSLLVMAVLLSAMSPVWRGSTVVSPTGKEPTSLFKTICTCPQVRISLQPYDFTLDEAYCLKADLEKNLCPQSGEWAFSFDVLSNKPLTNELKNDAGTRFRADKIINSLEKNADSHHIIIALPHQDISVSYKGKPDWGVLGLSLIPKKACVVSTYRLKNQRDLWKLAAHEFIHTCFNYRHCPDNDPKCIMKDANGHPDFSNKSTFCKKCSNIIFM